MKTTIDMAREAGLLTWLKPPEDVIERFKAFEVLVREDERDACAKVCDDYDVKYDVCSSDTAESIATAIRNRGQA
jgi:hypothetical protein